MMMMMMRSDIREIYPLIGEWIERTLLLLLLFSLSPPSLSTYLPT